MKAIKKSMKILFFSILILIGYQQYQRYKFKDYKPKIENLKSLNLFLSKNNYIADTTVIVAKSWNSYQSLQNYFAAGSIYIFDKNYKVIDDNITSEKGSCYSDISEFICDDFINANTNFEQKVNNRQKLLFTNTINLKGEKVQLKEYDYLIVYSWAKYLPPTYDKQLLSFLECTKNKKVAVLSLNLDFFETWKIPNDIKKTLKTN